MLVPDDLEPLLESALTRAGQPVDVKTARKVLPVGKKPKMEQIQAALDQLVAHGRIHRWPDGKRFSTASPLSFVKEQVLQALAAAPLTESDIKKKVSASARPLVKAAITALEKERTVVKHPKLGTRQPYGLGPPDALTYLAPKVAATFKPLMKLGFTEADLRLALRRYAGEVTHNVVLVDASVDIVATMLRLNSQASRGALIYISELRAALKDQFRDKESFDGAILKLAKDGKVQLQASAWPGRLSESDRNALIPNGQGGFFDAIGIRLE